MYKPPALALHALEKYHELSAATTPDEPFLGALVDTYEKQIEFAFTGKDNDILVRTGDGDPDREMAIGVSIGVLPPEVESEAEPEDEAGTGDNHPDNQHVYYANLAVSPDEGAIYDGRVAPSVVIELPIDSNTGKPDMLPVFAYLHNWITNTRIPSTLYQAFTIRELNTT